MKKIRFCIWAGWIMALISCAHNPKDNTMQFEEIQVTSEQYGHFLNSTQVFSPDDQWIVYDTRNADASIGETDAIEMVNIQTKEIKSLYKVPGQTKFGPGVGAATFSPTENTVLFIHGIRNADESKPYGFARRTAVGVRVDEPQKPVFFDARCITPPFVPGALRGGTHAYSWSADGQWLCFTYNDYVMEQLAKTVATVKDLRTIAVMAPGKVTVPEDTSLENNNGEMFSAVVATVVENPTPGSDEIDKAFDEGWVGARGYKKADGSWQKRAVAFQGNVRTPDNRTVTEVFITDIPDDITQADDGKPLEGTAASRPNVPKGTMQRRLTYTKTGVEGARHWLKSSSDGEWIFYQAKDGKGIVQIAAVSPNGGPLKFITQNEFSVAGPINISPDDKYVSYIADNSVFITEITTGVTYRLTARAADDVAPFGAVIWSNGGEMLTFNRKQPANGQSYVQVCLLKKSS